MRIALITGASSGLGREFARQVDAAHEVDEIWGVGRNGQALRELEKELATTFRPMLLDLTQSTSLTALRKILEQEKPGIEIVINAAGFGRIGSWQDIPLADCAAMIDLNCKAAVFVTQLAIPYMVRYGRILEICSAAAFQPLPYINVYSASKSFLYHYSCALHDELKGRQIGVTAVCPYWIDDTKFIERAKQTEEQDYVTNYMLPSKSPDVVRQALADAAVGAMLSTPGMVSRLDYIAAKIVPFSLAMKIWNIFRKKTF